MASLATEKEGFAEIAGERDAVVQELQRSKATLAEQLKAATAQVGVVLSSPGTLVSCG